MTSTQSRQGGARVRFPPPLVFLAGIALGVFLHYVAAPLRLPIGTGVRVFSSVVVAGAGFALIGAAFRLFKRSGQDPAPWLPSPSMIAAGPYRFTRNPMYVGMTLIQLGVGLAANDSWIVLLAPVSLAVVHVIAVLPEEAYLAERFGDDYARYRATVRRYL